MLFARRIEVVIGGIGAFRVAALLGSITLAGWGRLSSVCCYPLNTTYVAERAISLMPSCSKKQPGDGIRIGRVGVGNRFTGDGAPVLKFPCGPGIVPTDECSAAVSKVCLRSFKSPSVLTFGRLLAPVNLYT
jgi:hypothetical protein